MSMLLSEGRSCGTLDGVCAVMEPGSSLAKHAVISRAQPTRSYPDEIRVDRYAALANLNCRSMTLFAKTNLRFLLSFFISRTALRRRIGCANE